MADLAFRWCFVPVPCLTIRSGLQSLGFHNVVAFSIPRASSRPAVPSAKVGAAPVGNSGPFRSQRQLLRARLFPSSAFSTMSASPNGPMSSKITGERPMLMVRPLLPVFMWVGGIDGLGWRSLVARCLVAAPSHGNPCMRVLGRKGESEQLVGMNRTCGVILVVQTANHHSVQCTLFPIFILYNRLEAILSEQDDGYRVPIS